VVYLLGTLLDGVEEVHQQPETVFSKGYDFGHSTGLGISLRIGIPHRCALSYWSKEF